MVVWIRERESAVSHGVDNKVLIVGDVTVDPIFAILVLSRSESTHSAKIVELALTNLFQQGFVVVEALEANSNHGLGAGYFGVLTSVLQNILPPLLVLGVVGLDTANEWHALLDGGLASSEELLIVFLLRSLVRILGVPILFRAISVGVVFRH